MFDSKEGQEHRSVAYKHTHTHTHTHLFDPLSHRLLVLGQLNELVKKWIYTVSLKKVCLYLSLL